MFDLIVGDVGCDDYENVACLDYHIKLGTTLIFFCFWRDCWEIVSIAKIGMNWRDRFTSQSWAASTLPILSPVTGNYINIRSCNRKVFKH